MLRAMVRDDLAVLHRLHDDVGTAVLAEVDPWTPETLEQALARYDAYTPDPANVRFTIASLADGQVLGRCVVWGIDAFNRNAHLGISLLPQARGRGYGLDALRVMCDYAFRIRGLHRLGLETLATNTAMIATAEKAGFRREGVHREHAWVLGAFVDEVLFGLLATEFS
ncbi:N-acetyltransferase [Planobispora rosea]|uniref:N-acetyltransferase n=1 Tax=Planobispora rosea TaxID=35762 RepID=A0A8J3WAH1_PLARO|nr:N-acetyltransferase [Planobispora rosea]GIH81797.1 N-acetyltransferase [Planobispora rosea]